MKKTSFIMLLLLPVLAFGIIAVSGIVINEGKNKPMTSLEIRHPELKIVGGEKIILVGKNTTVVSLYYKFAPDDATDTDVIWEITEGEGSASVDAFGVVTLLFRTQDVTVRLHDKSNLLSDTVQLILR